MANQADIVGATVDFLESSAELANLVDTRIFGVELPPGQAADMPRKALTVAPAGGFEDDDFVPWTATRFDLWCYGETASESDKVRRAAHGALKNLERTTGFGQSVVGATEEVILFTATMSAGPTYFRDQDTDWPVSMETWVIRAAETPCN